MRLKSIFGDPTRNERSDPEDGAVLGSHLRFKHYKTLISLLGFSLSPSLLRAALELHNNVVRTFSSLYISISFNVVSIISSLFCVLRSWARAAHFSLKPWRWLVFLGFSIIFFFKHLLYKNLYFPVDSFVSDLYPLCLISACVCCYYYSPEFGLVLRKLDVHVLLFVRIRSLNLKLKVVIGKM